MKTNYEAAGWSSTSTDDRETAVTYCPLGLELDSSTAMTVRPLGPGTGSAETAPGRGDGRAAAGTCVCAASRWT